MVHVGYIGQRPMQTYAEMQVKSVVLGFCIRAPLAANRMAFHPCGSGFVDPHFNSLILAHDLQKEPPASAGRC